MTFSTIIEINLESKSFKHNFCKYLELFHVYLINAHHQNKNTIKDIQRYKDGINNLPLFDDDTLKSQL